LAKLWEEASPSGTENMTTPKMNARTAHARHKAPRTANEVTPVKILVDQSFLRYHSGTESRLNSLHGQM
jgi:hypothetical protein